jgi:hypothetical protein
MLRRCLILVSLLLIVARPVLLALKLHLFRNSA